MRRALILANDDHALHDDTSCRIRACAFWLKSPENVAPFAEERSLSASFPRWMRKSPHAKSGTKWHGHIAERSDLDETAALRQANWKISGKGGAAELLEIKPSTLESRMKAFAIERPT